MSNEYKIFLKKRKKEKLLILFSQFFILFSIIVLWQILSDLNIINSFISSSPKKILDTLINLHKANNLYNHIWTTFIETVISFLLSFTMGFVIASIMWFSKYFSKIIEPYLTILNSLPKIALGPIIIIVFGANYKSIIIMALSISVIIAIVNMYQGFINTNQNQVKMFKSFQCSKMQLFFKLIIPSSMPVFLNTLKLNISMSLIGVIMGEFLVSKQGIGYLIMYGSQVFNLNLVFTGIFLLLILSYLMYCFICYIEKKLIKFN